MSALDIPGSFVARTPSEPICVRAKGKPASESVEAADLDPIPGIHPKEPSPTPPTTQSTSRVRLKNQPPTPCPDFGG